MNIAFGLDFGTSNSVLAVPEHGAVKIIDIDPHSVSQKMLKSVLYFGEDNIPVIGQDAVDQYLVDSLGRFIQSIKTFLPSKSFADTYIGGKRYHLEDLISIILSEIKRRGEVFVGHRVDAVVMGRPVVFSEDKELDALAESRLKKAAMQSGFTDVQFVYEPMAAMRAYENSLQESEEKLVFMGDFGGGTSDFVIMRLKGGTNALVEDRTEDILAIGGVYVAGDAFDSAIMWHKLAKHFGRGAKTRSSTPGQILDAPVWLTHTLCQWHMIPRLRDRKTLQVINSLIGVSEEDKRVLGNLHTLVVENLGYELFQAIEKTKCELSSQSTSIISFEKGEVRIHEEITRQEFEDLAREEFGKIEACVDDVLMRAGVLPTEIDTVVLTGGSSFIPKIRKIFLDRFTEDRMFDADAFTSVAYGLGLYASRC